MVKVWCTYGYNIEDNTNYFRISANYNFQKEFYCDIRQDELTQERLGLMLRALGNSVLNG